MCRRKSENPKQCHNLSEGGEAKLYHREEKTWNHTVLCHSRSSQNTQIAPGPEEEGIDSTKNKTTRKNDSPVPQLCTERGDVGSTKYAGTILNPAQKLRKRILCHDRAASLPRPAPGTEQGVGRTKQEETPQTSTPKRRKRQKQTDKKKPPPPPKPSLGKLSSTAAM